MRVLIQSIISLIKKKDGPTAVEYAIMRTDRDDLHRHHYDRRVERERPILECTRHRRSHGW